MSGELSTCALTSDVIRDTGGDGGDSCGLFGFDGKRPLRPFKLSVLTTNTIYSYSLGISYNKFK